MKDDKKVPQLRFPEFTDAWKQRELKEVVNFSRGQGLPWADVDDLNGQFECILYGNLYTDYGTIIQNIKHKTNTDLKVKSKGNEVLIPGSDTTPTGLARALFLEKENVILGGDINILSVKHDDGPFLAYELNKLKKELIIRIKGTTVKHLQNNDLKDIVVSLPSLEEQRKISSLFSRLDNTITLQQRKLNSLQKLKKGLLQKMFPKKGENIPEIRFPEFSDAWKQRELGEIAERVTRRNSSLESQTPLTISAEYGLIDQNKFFGKRIAAKDLSNYYLIQKGEFAYNKSTSNDAPWGAIKRLDCYNNGALSTLYIVFKIKDNKSCYSDFLVTYYGTSLWHKGVKEIASEGARNHGLLNVSPSDFFRTKLVIPQDFEEQRKIGAFFTQLDNTITLQQRWLFYTHKQS